MTNQAHVRVRRAAAVDWFRLLWDMAQRGHSLMAISRDSGIAHGTLRRYLHDAHPPHWRGEILIEMWMDRTGMDREQVPMLEMMIAPRVIPGPKMGNVESGRDLQGVWR